MAIPRDATPDASLALLREGYDFVGNRCRRLGTDVFATRLLLQPAVCASGADAARTFYGRGLTRRRALPLPILTLLQDLGSVQLLDGEAHRHRKAMFMALMGPASLGRLRAIADEEWQAAIRRWEGAGDVVLLDGAHELLCRVACRWTGIPLSEGEVGPRTEELAAMIDGTGSVGPRNLRGHRLRRRTERWAAGIVRRIRSGTLRPPEDAPARALAEHRDARGSPLPEEVAAVELINLLRPVVAVARYVAFCALALHEHPETAAAAATPFVHEVRRLAPFFPAVAGRVVEPFEWRGEELPRGRRVLLDLYGTNRDPRAWPNPDRFDPGRFEGWAGDPFAFVPQGGGDHATGHRCAGEWATIALMEVAVDALRRRMRYEVPPQDLRVRRSRMPAQPESGFVLRAVRAA